MNQKKEKTLERIIQIFKENAELPENIQEMNESSELAGLGITSIDFIKVIIAIEAEYGFEIDDDDLSLSNFQTIGDLVDYILQIQS